MKKPILMLAAVGAAACCFGACGESYDEYATLNEMLNADYSQVVLTVTNTFDERTSLSSVYTIKYFGVTVTVEYAVEQFTKIDASLDGPAEDVITTLTGEMIIQGGVVTSRDGDDVNLTAEVAYIGLEFKEEYFANVELTGNYLKAEVTNASAFLGSQLTCTDMKVYATFIEVFNEITVTYTSESGSLVEYDYIFTL